MTRTTNHASSCKCQRRSQASEASCISVMVDVWVLSKNAPPRARFIIGSKEWSFRRYMSDDGHLRIHAVGPRVCIAALGQRIYVVVGMP